MSPEDLKQNWTKCVDELRDAVNNRSFWDAIESAVPIALDADVLVLGLPVEKSNLSGHLDRLPFSNTVQQSIVRHFAGAAKFRVIEGTGEDDWAITRARDAKTAELRAGSRQNAPASGDTGGWEALGEKLSRTYAATEMRGLAQNRAKFLVQALELTARSMKTLYVEPADEHTQRQLARIIERIATAVEAPSVFIAFELEKVQKALQSAPGD